MLDLVLLRIVLLSALVSAVVGGAYGYAAHDALALGVTLGLAFGALFSLLEAVLFQGAAGARLRRLPFLANFALRAGAYVVLIVAIEALFVRLMMGADAVRGISVLDLGFALLASVVGNLVYAIADLLGPGVLLAFAAGRYHRPRPEERALLFIDIKGSTAKAERLGQARFLDFLDAFIVDVSRDIVANGGEIHKYVGDEIIATWRLKPGRNAIGIARACFAARDRLQARRAAYEREFGFGAEFRAALHAGVVVVGEIGSFKKEIALIGDPMNTAARILDACRELDVATLASAALIERLYRMPDGIECRAVAPPPLRGKAAPLELAALAPAPAPRRLKAVV